MIKWPFKMWLWPEQEIAYGSWVENDPRLIQVHVLPEAPEPVGYAHPYHIECLREARCSNIGVWREQSHPMVPVYASPLPPSTIRQEERERCAKACDELECPGDSPADDLSFEIGTMACAAAIRALTDEEKKG